MKRKFYSIGINIDAEGLRLVQLARGSCGGRKIVVGGTKSRPSELKLGNGSLQTWLIESVKQLLVDGEFHGREAVGGVPVSELFIETLKLPGFSQAKDEKTVLSKIKSKLDFEPAEAILRFIPSEDDNVIVLAVRRQTIDYYLAVYEQAGLRVKQIGVWPAAMADCYAAFFGRRKSDREAVVMLVGIDADSSNVVICRHKKLLFARAIQQTAICPESEKFAHHLVLNLKACSQHFQSLYGNTQIQRLIFLSNWTEHTRLCEGVAKEMQLPARIANCLSVIDFKNSNRSAIDRRNCESNLAVSFGYSIYS